MNKVNVSHLLQFPFPTHIDSLQILDIHPYSPNLDIFTFTLLICSFENSCLSLSSWYIKIDIQEIAIPFVRENIKESP